MNGLEVRGKKKQTYLHSDQGWQYQIRGYQAILLKYGIRQSMSRRKLFR
ncbi:DDE-type integrase/transposase/recombinase [Haemophilus haemolyticus]